ncbi:MAG: non-canonical purine NTP pyrophosphatase [Planctomycetota bacterium]
MTGVQTCALPISEPSRKDEVLFTVEGSVQGEILREADGADGFGYDPLFFHPDSGKSFARLSADEKSRISHRGMAVQKLRARFKEYLS